MSTTQGPPAPGLWMRRLVLTGLLVMGTALSGYGGLPPEQLNLTRSEAVTLAIRHNIELRVTALGTSLAETSLARSRGIYDPVLSSSVSGGKTTYPGESFETKSAQTSIGLSQILPTGLSIAASTQASVTGYSPATPGLPNSDWQTRVGISLSQPLLKNAGKDVTELNITLAANSWQGSLERFQFALADTVFAVVTAYNRLHTLRQILLSHQAALDSAVAMRERLATGKRSRSAQGVETANVAYAIAQRQKDLVDADRNVQSQQAYLRYLIGLDEKIPLIPVEPPSRDEPLESEKEAIALALANRADLEQLQLDLKSSELQESVAKHQVLPDLSLSAGGGLSGLGEGAGDTFKQIGDGEGAWWSAGLSLRVPLGNTSAKNDYQLNKIRTEQLRNRVTAFRWQVRNAVESDMRALISARLQLRTTDQSYKFAEQRLDEYRKHSQTGTASVQDVLNAENDLTAARNAQMDAVEGFAYAVLLLWRDSGVLLERQRIHVDLDHPAQLTQGPSAPAGSEKATQPKGALKGFTAQLPPGTLSPARKPQPSPAPAAPPSPVSAVPGNNRAPHAAPPVVAAAKPGGAEAYALIVGEYQAETALREAGRRVTELGLNPTVKQERPRRQVMYRLLVGEFTQAQAANQALTRLQREAPDGFLLRAGNSGFALYAGSYRSRSGALVELRRLADRGVKASLQEAHVVAAVSRLTAGPFASREAADKALQDLGKHGFSPRLVASDG